MLQPLRHKIASRRHFSPVHQGRSASHQ